MKFSPYVVTILAIALIAGTMSGCSKHHEENTADYSMPEEMKDCKVFYIAPDGMGSPIHVVYCPGKTTVAERYAVGKTHRDVNVVTDAVPDSGAVKLYACTETGNGTLTCSEKN